MSWYRDPGSAIFGATEGKVGLLSLAWASKFDSSVVSNFYYYSISILINTLARLCTEDTSCVVLLSWLHVDMKQNVCLPVSVVSVICALYISCCHGNTC